MYDETRYAKTFNDLSCAAAKKEVNSLVRWPTIGPRPLSATFVKYSLDRRNYEDLTHSYNPDCVFRPGFGNQSGFACDAQWRSSERDHRYLRRQKSDS